MKRPSSFHVLMSVLALIASCASPPPKSEPRAASPPASSAPAPAATPPANPVRPLPNQKVVGPTTITCFKGGDQRSLSLHRNEGGCLLFYSKDGLKKRVAWSDYGRRYCEKVRSQMKRSLESAGFNCAWSLSDD